MANELSPAHRVQWELYDSRFRDALLNQWRFTAVDDDWWDGVYDQCVEENAALGITVDKDSIRFSGFASQGDGAMFAGTVDDWEKFLIAVGKPELWSIVKDYGLNNEFSNGLRFGSFFGGGRYCHEHSARFRDELYLHGRWPYSDEAAEKVDVLRYAAWDQLTRAGRALEDCSEEFEAFFRARMKKLYRDLESLYNELTGDEAIIEDILDMYSVEELVERQRKFLHETV